MAQYALRRAAADVPEGGVLDNEDEVRFAFAVLLHDAAEAYMGDLPQAVKHALPQFKEMEREIQHQVWRRYNLVGIASVRHADIKELDNRIYYHEKRAMFPSHDQCLVIDRLPRRSPRTDTWPWLAQSS